MADSSTADKTSSFYKIIGQLNNTVNEENLLMIKLVASHALDIFQQQLEESSRFDSVYKLIETKYPYIAPDLVVIILEGLGIQSSLISELKTSTKNETPVSESVRDCHQKMDFILTVLRILRNLRKDKYLSFKEIARCTFLKTYDSSNIKSRTDLLHLLLDNGCLTCKSFFEIFAWLEEIGCSFFQAELKDYCDRYAIEKPDFQASHPLSIQRGKLHVLYIVLMVIYLGVD